MAKPLQRLCRYTNKIQGSGLMMEMQIENKLVHILLVMLVNAQNHCAALANDSFHVLPRP
jgi:hypothetical protein